MTRVNSILEGLYSDRSELNDKRTEYRRYIDEHISNVRWAFEKHFLLLLSADDIDDELKEAINKASLAIPYHDQSKYEPEEFEGYRMHFYPTEAEKKDSSFEKRAKQLYDAAWEHHHKNNPHHPIHWVENGVKKDMPLEYIIEMLCDWIAMSYKFGDSTLEWYEKEADEEKKCFTEKTKKLVEYLLYERVSLTYEVEYKKGKK